MKLILPGEYTDLNTYIRLERANKFSSASRKKTETERVYWECKIQKLSLEDSGRFFIFVWYSKNKKKDPDNIAFSKKFIMDGLYQAGVIVNDTQEYVKGFVDLFLVDAENPRVELTTWVSLAKAQKYLSEL